MIYRRHFWSKTFMLDKKSALYGKLLTACRFYTVHQMAGFVFSKYHLMFFICSKFKQTCCYVK